MNRKTPSQNADLDLALSYLEMAWRKLAGAREPSLMLATSALLSKAKLAAQGSK